MRRATLLLTVMAAALVVVSGVALVATLNGTGRVHKLVGTARGGTIKCRASRVAAWCAR